MDFKVVIMASGFMACSPEFVIACGVGQRFSDLLQCRRGIEAFGTSGLLQSTEAVQDVLFRGFPRFQSPGDSSLNLLLIVEQNQCEDVYHLPVAAWPLQQPCA